MVVFGRLTLCNFLVFSSAYLCLSCVIFLASSEDLKYPFAALAMMEMLASLQPDHDQSATMVSNFLRSKLGGSAPNRSPRTQAQTTAGNATTGDGESSHQDRQEVALNTRSGSQKSPATVGQATSGSSASADSTSEEQLPTLEPEQLDRVSRVLMTKVWRGWKMKGCTFVSLLMHSSC